MQKNSGSTSNIGVIFPVFAQPIIPNMASENKIIPDDHAAVINERLIWSFVFNGNFTDA
jgi:hypothetical protein